jgi:uncharacterized repeat protein (TIGR03803 family)
MKTSFNKTLLLTALIVGVGWNLGGRAKAQAFTTLYNFTALTNGTNGDGGTPTASLNLSGSMLYGTTVEWGISGGGTLFRINTDGSGFTNLHSFSAPGSTNSDGSGPACGLILSGDTLYGTASGGGSGNAGTVFAINTDGMYFTNLHSFVSGSDGAFPFGELILSSNILYGTTTQGGSGNAGTVFAINTDGAGFTNLHSFAKLSALFYNNGTNSEGAYPLAGLILSGNTLYGTANYGGSSGNGAVFKINTDGTGFTNLHNFTTLSAPWNDYGTNSDGANPSGGLILSGNTLYGAADYGGSSGNGTIFAINASGNGFTNLHNFAAGINSSFPVTNSEGGDPFGGLLLSGNTIYGTAYDGGTSGNGTIFALNTNGTDFTNFIALRKLHFSRDPIATELFLVLV